MGELITLKEEDHPRLKCPHCHNVIGLDIRPWLTDATKIMEDRCPKCNATIVVGMLLIAHKDMRSFIGALKSIIDHVNSQNQILGRG